MTDASYFTLTWVSRMVDVNWRRAFERDLEQLRWPFWICLDDQWELMKCNEYGMLGPHKQQSGTTVPCHGDC